MDAVRYHHESSPAREPSGTRHRRSRTASRRRTFDQFHLAGPERPADPETGRQKNHRAGDGQCSENIQSAEDGCTQFNGQYRGLSRGDRSCSTFRAFFYRPDHGGRPDTTGKGFSDRRRGSRIGRNRRCKVVGRHRQGFRHET